MSRPSPGKLAAFFAILLAASALPVWLKGGLYLTNFEGDAFHLADIVLRMAAGERPHLDFLTPIGALAFWPVVLFQRAGLDLGHAFAAGQALFAALAAIPLWRAAASRLSRLTAYVFGGVVILLLTSLSHGYDTANLAVSMHYNRWAWALVFAATLLVLLPDRGRPRPTLDGALTGAILVTVALLKVTYVVTFAPALLLIALLRGETRMIAAGLGTALALAGLLLIAPGFAHLAGYVQDVQAVAAAPLRKAPGLELADLAVSPAYLAPTLVLIGAALFLRRARYRAEGLALLILLPAFLVTTWQNFGNDPLWLVLLAAILAALYDADRANLRPVAVLAAVALALSVPMLVVHGGSGLRLLTLDTARYTALVPGRDGLADLHMATRPAHLARARTVLNDEPPYDRLDLTRPDPATVAGEPLADCQLLTGFKGSLELIAADLMAEDWPVFPADILSSHWLYGGTPLPGASPWNYGTLHGAENAGHILVPLCPISARARARILSELEDAGVPLTLTRRTPTYLLFEVTR